MRLLTSTFQGSYSIRPVSPPQLSRSEKDTGEHKVTTFKKSLKLYPSKESISKYIYSEQTGSWFSNVRVPIDLPLDK
jgi:hypothetical protein